MDARGIILVLVIHIMFIMRFPFILVYIVVGDDFSVTIFVMLIVVVKGIISFRFLGCGSISQVVIMQCVYINNFVFPNNERNVRVPISFYPFNIGRIPILVTMVSIVGNSVIVSSLIFVRIRPPPLRPIFPFNKVMA